MIELMILIYNTQHEYSQFIVIFIVIKASSQPIFSQVWRQVSKKLSLYWHCNFWEVLAKVSCSSTYANPLHILQTTINQNIRFQLFMERRPWTPQQDLVLKSLYEKVKLNKWSLIATRMEEEYELPPRTGKQCRQRYNNHLNPTFPKELWTQQQQQLLIQLHNQLGNKWAIIASRIGGRTDNAVKNYFFAKLRKSMRKINKLMQERFQKKGKELKLNVLYKIVEASEEKFKKTPLCSQQVSEKSCVLKNKILSFSLDNSQQVSNEELTSLINEMIEFGKSYKRKPKQLRRLPEHTRQTESAVSGQNDEEQSNSEQEDSKDQIIRPDQRLLNVEHPKVKRLEKIANQLKTSRAQIIQAQPNLQSEAHRILDNLMIQEDQNFLMPPLAPPFLKKASSEFIVDALRPDQNFFEQSGMHNQLPSPLAFTPLVKKESLDQQLFRLSRD